MVQVQDKSSNIIYPMLKKTKMKPPLPPKQQRQQTNKQKQLLNTTTYSLEKIVFDWKAHSVNLFAL